MAYVGNPIDTQNTFQSLQGKRFNGDGSTTAFTLDVAPSSTLDIEVFVGNVRQDPNSAYTLSGTTLTFTGAPPSGTNNIYVVHQAKSVGTIDVPALGVSTASIQADAITEAKIADDAVESEHLNNNVISGQTELAATPADTDELLISDAGTIKRIDFSHIKSSNTPAFEAKLGSDMNVTDNAQTKVTCGTEVFDTDNAYDNSTNYRFTPQTAGKYYVYGGVGSITDETHLKEARAMIWKNGSRYRTSTSDPRNNLGYHYNNYVAAIVDMNGSSDYVELYGLTNKDGGTDCKITKSHEDSTYFGAFKIAGV